MGRDFHVRARQDDLFEYVEDDCAASLAWMMSLDIFVGLVAETTEIVGMVGGMVWALSQNKSLKEVIQMGVCCGTAATMNEGTQLFRVEDVEKLFKEMQS
jgi:glucose uptake protein GlcU